MNVGAVVFDIGKVLIDWLPEAFYDARIGVARRRAFFDETRLYEMHQRIDAGEDSFAVTREHAVRHPGWAAELHAWHDEWEGTLGGAIPGSAEVLRAVRARGVPVFALSNFGSGTYARTKPLFPVLSEFDREFISGDLGLIKPDPAIYAAVETAAGVSPEALFFTDDRPENVAAAGARGWKGHLFEGADGLAARLRSEGVL